MKRVWIWILAAAFLLGLTGCGKEEIITMNMGAGDMAGIYYSYGGVLGQQIRDNTGIQISVAETEGSGENLQGLGSGEFQMSLVQSDVMSYAWQGRRDFDEARVDNFRVVAGLYWEPVQIITVNPEIHYVEDLRGMRVSVGAPNSGINFNAMDVLDALSMTEDDIQARYFDVEETMKALHDGTIDAAFLVAGTPMPALKELAEVKEISLVPIEGPVAERILTSCSFYEVYTIPADTYPGQKQDVKTLAVRATLVVSADASKDTVYQITKSVFDHTDAIRACNIMGRELNQEEVSKGITVPFHPGAVKYFDEHDVTVK